MAFFFRSKYSPLLILISFFCLVSFFNLGHKFEGHLGDFGRELYIPQAMDQGDVLYQDIINIFGPLSYQINSVVTGIFGHHLLVYYALGLIAGSICITYLYKIALMFVTRDNAFVCTLGVVSAFLLSFNAYTMPYAYAAVYATTSIIAATFYFLQYLNDNRDKYLIFTFLAAGFSFANKYEFVLLIFVLFLYVIIKKPSKLFLSLIMFSVFPLFSLLVLITSGWNIASLPTTLGFMAKYVSAPSLQILYSRLSTYIPYPIMVGYSLATFVLSAVIIGLIVFISFLLRDKHRYSNTQKAIFVTITALFLLVTLLGNMLFYSGKFSYLPLTLGICLLLWKKLPLPHQRSANLKVLIVLAVAGSFKGFIATAITYSPFTLCLALLSFFILLSCILDHFKLYKSTIYLSILMLTLPNFLVLQAQNATLTCEIATNKGTLYIEPDSCVKFQNIINTLKEDKSINQVNVVPDGMLFNYLTDKPADNILTFMFMPPYMEAYGEDKLINDIKNRNNYNILVQKHDTLYLYADPNNKKAGVFGEQYGVKVLDFLNNNYRDFASIENEFIYFKK